jgi:hypothetical protein
VGTRDKEHLENRRDYRYSYTMKTGNEITVLEKLLRPMPRSLTAEVAHALVNLRVDEEVQARYDELAEKSTEGGLTEAEKEELDEFVRANTFLGLLKAEAKTMLVSSR